MMWSGFIAKRKVWDSITNSESLEVVMEHTRDRRRPGFLRFPLQSTHHDGSQNRTVRSSMLAGIRRSWTLRQRS
jgi:hypothetical protein